jgi:exonuclease III
MLRIGILNVNGLGDKKKKQALKAALKSPDIALLQETHLNSTKGIKFPNQVHTYMTTAAGGTAILGSSKVVVDPLNTDVPRITSAMISIPQEDWSARVFSIYAPNVNGTRASKTAYMEFLQELDTLLSMPHAGKLTLVGGDFNIIMNKHLDAEKHNPGSFFPDLIKEWERLCAKHGLSDAFRMLHPTEEVFSYASGVKMRRLDYALISTNAISTVKTCSYVTTHISDHKLMQLTLATGRHKAQYKLWKHKDALLTSPGYVDELVTAVNEAKAEAHEASLTNQGTWEYIKYKIRKHARHLEKKHFEREKEEREALAQRINRDFKDKNVTVETKMANKRLKELDLEAADRLAKAAKMTWFEDNEKSTKFFYSRIAQGNAESNAVTLRVDGNLVEGKAVNEQVYKFYKNLYAKREDIANDLFPHWPIPSAASLTDDERTSLSRDVTEEELKHTLFKLTKEGKAPGNDGLTVALYRSLWRHVGPPLAKSLEEGLQGGKLSTSQRQSVIRLIRKKDKDPELLKNWRPISLINVDAKLLSRALTERLKKVLPKLISREQLGFMKNRNIHDGNRLIDYFNEYIEAEDKGGWFVALDFEKAFDSISHEYLKSLLVATGLPGEFVEMVTTLTKECESSVINNSTTTSYFPLARSCRQGDPIAPYLFILAIEPLLRRLNNDRQVSGLRTPLGQEVKLSAYADDITLLLRNETSWQAALAIVKEFEQMSGLRVNEEKTEFLKLGTESVPGETQKPMTITGITHEAPNGDRAGRKKHLEKIEGKLESITNMWKGRGLTLMGRIQAAKAQLHSQVRYLAEASCVEEKHLKKFDKLIYKFVWKGPDKLTRNTLEKRKSIGGQGFIPLTTQARMLATSWLGKLTSTRHPWTDFLRWDLAKGLGEDISKPKARSMAGNYLPFNAHILAAARSLQREYAACSCLPTETVDGNSALKGRGRGRLTAPRLAQRGIVRLEQFTGPEPENLDRLEKTEWTKVRRILDRALRQMPKPPVDLADQPNHRTRGALATVTIASLTMVNKDINYENMKKALTANTAVPESKRWNVWSSLDADLTGSLFEKRWNDEKLFLDTRTKDFVFRLHSGVLYANKDLHRFGIRETTTCQHCGEAVQTMAHLFQTCAPIQTLVRNLATSLGLETSTWKDVDDNERHYLLKIYHIIYSENNLGLGLDIERILPIFNDWLSLSAAVHEKRSQMEPFLDKWRKGLDLVQA